MKRFVLIIVSLVLAIALTACGARYPWEIGDENTYVFEDGEDVQLILEEGTLSQTGGIFYLKNRSEVTIYSGQSYVLQIQIDGKWHDIIQDSDFTAEQIIVNPNGKYKFDNDWSNIYGELPEGTYRMVKYYSVYPDGEEDFYISCEFVIE